MAFRPAEPVHECPAHHRRRRRTCGGRDGRVVAVGTVVGAAPPGRGRPRAAGPARCGFPGRLETVPGRSDRGVAESDAPLVLGLVGAAGIIADSAGRRRLGHATTDHVVFAGRTDIVGHSLADDRPRLDRGVGEPGSDPSARFRGRRPGAVVGGVLRRRAATSGSGHVAACRYAGLPAARPAHRLPARARVVGDPTSSGVDHAGVAGTGATDLPASAAAGLGRTRTGGHDDRARAGGRAVPDRIDPGADLTPGWGWCRPLPQPLRV